MCFGLGRANTTNVQPQGKGACTSLHVALIMLYGGIFGVNGITLETRVRPVLPFGRLAFAFRPVDNHSRGSVRPLSNFLFTIVFSYLFQEL